MNQTKVVISQRRYKRLMAELARRGGGHRESGAFLLAARRPKQLLGSVEVVDVAYYDDLDPGSLTGGITMHDVGFTALNRYCRDKALMVVGDVHTHPSSIVRQSHIDASNPMIAFAGHVAIIAPNYAQRKPKPPALGVHLFLGSGRWQSHFGRDGEDVLQVFSWPTRVAGRFARRFEDRSR